MEKSVFATLNAINCNDKTEKKNGLTYLAWAFAWGEVKKNYPDANYKIYENADGWNYFTDGRTCWVKTGVTIQGQEHIEMLPVMDTRNRSIPFESVTSFDVNKAIQRSLTKACARHGLGLYIYAGEDLPDAADDAAREEVKARRKVVQKTAPAVNAANHIMTPTEFITRWDSDEHGGGITNDDCADCAKAWGVCSNPRIKPINEVVDAVVEYARKHAKKVSVQPLATAPTRAEYYAIVRAYADGKPTKSGGDYRETFIQTYNPTAEMLDKFDLDVQDYRAAKTDGVIL